MNELINSCIVPIFSYASTIAFIMAIITKGVNVIIKAFVKGEIRV